MKLKVKDDFPHLDDCGLKQLVRLLESMGEVPFGTIGYRTIHGFVVIAGHFFGIYSVVSNPTVHVINSGTLILEVSE